MTKASLEYLAGFFDGEGYIGVVHESVNKRYALRVTVFNNDPAGPAMFVEVFGGKVQQRKQNGQRIESWFWLLHGRFAKKFIEVIEPHLVLKKAEAQLALQFPIMDGGQRTSEEIKQRQREIYERLQEIKTERSQLDVRERKLIWDGGLEDRPEVQRAIELYKSGMTMEAVAAAVQPKYPDLNLTHAHISYWMRATGNNISRSDAHRRSKKNQENAIKNRPECIEAKRLYEQGVPVIKICNRLNVKEKTVYYWLRAMGVESPDRLKNDPDAQEALRLYQSGMSAREVAEHIGRSTSTIGHWLASMGVRRSRAEARKLRVKYDERSRNRADKNG